METDASKITKISVLVVILAIFAVIGWRLGAPDSFNKTLADAGLTQQMAAPAPAQQPAAPAQQPASPEQQPAAPAAPSPETAPAPSQPQPQQPQTSADGH